MAQGLGTKVLLIDTEAGRSEVYANEFEFDVLPLEPPFSPERYIEAITAGEKAGYEVIIVDSASHEWAGTGGLLDNKDKMEGANDWAKWAKLTPRHNQFVDKLIRTVAHLILTIRGKDTWILELDSKGKQKPKKVGVGGQQREGMEYEFTVAFVLDQESHVATVSKDNTHLFENVYDVLTPEAGERLKAWATEGKVATQPPAPWTPTGAELRKALIEELGEVMRSDVFDDKDRQLAGQIRKSEPNSAIVARIKEWTAERDSRMAQASVEQDDHADEDLDAIAEDAVDWQTGEVTGHKEGELPL